MLNSNHDPCAFAVYPIFEIGDSTATHSVIERAKGLINAKPVTWKTQFPVTGKPTSRRLRGADVLRCDFKDRVHRERAWIVV